MKFLQLGLIVAIALAVLLGSALWVMAQPAPPDPEPTVETSATQAVGLLITATVGTVQGACAITNTVQVTANTTVYYCFTLDHTGVAGEEALTSHRVQYSHGAVNRELPTFALNPGVDPTKLLEAGPGLPFTDTTSVDVTNFITWTARPQDGEPQVVDSTLARVDVVNPVISVVNTVGQDRTTCPVARTLRVPTGTNVSFCVSLENTGDITFTSHTLTYTPLNISASFNYTLPPRATLDILPTNMAGLGINGSLERSNVTAPFSTNASVTSRTGSGLTATGTSTATVDIGTTTVRMTKRLSTAPEDCSGSNTIQVPPGTDVYYCVTIENTGVVTLTQHRLTETFLSIDVMFEYPLRPGEQLNVTNDFLARNNQPIVFGPFDLDPKYGNVVNNTMTYAGSSDDGFSVSATAGTSSTFPPTPTNTATDRPDPTSTQTPIFTNTPTNTPIPQTPTPTLTPTFTPITPSPTPTRSYAISLLETPTPRTQVAGIPSAPQQDPIAVTATQMAVDATSTAVAAVATASQQQTENAAATALATTQASLPESPLELPPDSPLPTPTFDPSLPQDGSSSGLLVTPGLETPTLAPMPGADITVLPPLITVVVGSETPAVVMQVVTNTPALGEPGAGTTLPEGQRPIVYPTPTVTPDFVMAAARTFDVAVSTMGWLWFLVGSLVFFVTAGVVAGLFFRQSEVNRFELPEPEYWLEEEPQADHPRTSSQTVSDTRQARTGPSADDEWPAELP